MRSASATRVERRQFGRPIGSFQAVQQHLVTIAQQAALAGVAADASARRPGRVRDRRGQAARQPRGIARRTRGPPGPRRASAPPRASACASSPAGCGRGARSTATSTTGARGSGAAVARAGADSVYPAITGGSSGVERLMPEHRLHHPRAADRAGADAADARVRRQPGDVVAQPRLPSPPTARCSPGTCPVTARARAMVSSRTTAASRRCSRCSTRSERRARSSAGCRSAGISRCSFARAIPSAWLRCCSSTPARASAMTPRARRGTHG